MTVTIISPSVFKGVWGKTETDSSEGSHWEEQLQREGEFLEVTWLQIRYAEIIE